MKEFGSDFHFQKDYLSKSTHLDDIYPNAYFLANGRMCICTLIKQYEWKRIWIPEYFCYEVIESIRKTGIDICFYSDYPGNNDKIIIENIPFEKNDVLLRMNYFGMRKFRSEKKIPVAVIEDHTHDLLGQWALHSDADWCIASLRKTLPIPEGGMLWSPKGYSCNYFIKKDNDNEVMASERWKAMELKADYLMNKDINKESFRQIYLKTEDIIDQMDVICTIDTRSMEFLQQFDILEWYKTKKRNLNQLNEKIHLDIFQSEDTSNNLFSFICLMKNKEERDAVRKRLIENQVYTAALWSLPDNTSTKAKNISERMISIHCDGRYSLDNILELVNRINQVL